MLHSAINMDSEAGSSFYLEEKSPGKLCLRESSRLSDMNLTLPFKSPTSEIEFGVLDQHIDSTIGCDPEELEELPASNQIIPSGIESLVNTQEVAVDVSWTSSMATPLSKNVTYSNLNTNERRVFLPDEDCTTTVKRRALFTPDLFDSSALRSDDTETPRVERTGRINAGRTLLTQQLDNSLRSQLGSFSFGTLIENVEEQSGKRKSSETCAPVVSRKRLKMQKNRTRNKVVSSPEPRSSDDPANCTSVDMFNDSEEDIFSEFDNASSTPSRSTSEKGGSYAESTPSTSRSRSVENSPKAVTNRNESTELEKTVIEVLPKAEWSPDDSFSEAMVKAFPSFQASPVSELKSRVQSIKEASLNPKLLYVEEERPLSTSTATAEDILKSMAPQFSDSDTQPCKPSTLTNVIQQELVPFSQLKVPSTVQSQQVLKSERNAELVLCSSENYLHLNKRKATTVRVSSVDERKVSSKTNTPPEETSILTDQQLIQAGEEAEMLLLLENEDDWLCTKLDEYTGNECQTIDVEIAVPGSLKTANGRDGLVSLEVRELDADIDRRNRTLIVDGNEGFLSASGKKIFVSQDALRKAEKIFADVDEKSHPVDFGFMDISEPTFKTANGQTIFVSREALNKARKLFADDEKNEGYGTQSKKRKFEALSEDVGKTVVVSEELRRAKQFFSDEEDDGATKRSKSAISEDDGGVTLEDLCLEIENMESCPTANGNKASDDAVKKVTALFVDVESAEGELAAKRRSATHLLKTEQAEAASATDRFSTASGKKVTVSESALERARNIFADDNIFEELSELAARSRSRRTATRILPSKGFEDTASGRKLTISSSALEKSNELLAVEDTTEVSELAATKVLPGKVLEETRGGFATASGKQVTISSSALEKAKKLFVDEDIAIEDLSKLAAEIRGRRLAAASSPPNERYPLVSAGSGLATASSKQVRISKSALQNAKELLADEEATVENLLKGRNRSISGDLLLAVNEISTGKRRAVSVKGDGDESSAIQETVGFLSDGKSASVSEDSKARMLFEGIKNENSDLILKSDKTVLQSASSLAGGNSSGRNRKVFRPVENDGFKVPFSVINVSPRNVERDSNISGGFSTASGKSVDVSEKALLRAKALFEEVDKEGSLNVSSAQRNGFSTASGHYVGVSEESLKKTKHIFEESDALEETIASYKLRRSQPSESKKSLRRIKYDDSVVIVDQSLSEQENKTSNKTLSQEILESTAAFLVDESENSVDFPTAKLIEPLTSQPLAPEDRINAPKAVTAFPEDCSPIAPPGSPILGERPNGSHRKIRRKAVGRLSLSVAGKSSAPRLIKEEANLSLPVPLTVESSAVRSWEDDEGDEVLTKVEIDDVISGVNRIKEEEEQLGTGRELRPEVSEARKRAAEEQEKVVKAGIAGKKGPKVAKGSLFAKKSASPSAQRSWKSFVGSETPGSVDRDELRRLGVGHWVCNVTSENAGDFRFNAWNYYSADVCRENVFGLPVGDGARLILNDEGCVGVVEVERAFLASASVDPALVPSGWVRNHYRWIVWKLASLERRFPKHFARVLTPHVVMQQLKYRYDREIDRCQRPAFRKILEHDDSPARRMVTCVASIRKIDGESGASQVELELTDGWYSIFAVIDSELQSQVLRGKVTSGTKIVTHGAELINCPQGCPPLEISADVRLKITSNSSRRARWDTKLGFQRDPRPFEIPLSSVLSNGGMVGRLTVYVVRIYPLIYLEKKDKARTVVRSERAERREAALDETRRQKAAEEIYVEAQAEVRHNPPTSTETKSHVTRQLLAKATSNQQLCSLMESAIDPVAFQDMLSDEQKKMVLEFQREKQESLCREVQSKVKKRLEEKSIPQRSVTPVLKVRLVDGKKPEPGCSACLSIWHPLEDMSSLFKETQLTTMYNLLVNGWRAGVLQLSATRSTQYEQQREGEVSMPSHLARRLTLFGDLYARDFSPAFGEVDTVGVVVRLDHPPQQSASNNTETPGRTGSQYQSVYLADELHNIIAVSFWGGLKEFGLDGIVSVGVVLSMANLQWRGGALKGPICLYAQEVSVFTVNPRQQKLREAVLTLQKVIKPDVKSFVQSCEEKLEDLLKSATPYQSSANELSMSRHSPSASATICTPKVAGKSSAAGICTSTPVQHSPLASNLKEYSPGVQEKLKKLEKYSDASPLPPIVMAQRRSSLRRGFRPPRRALDTSATKVTDDEKKKGVGSTTSVCLL